jgi:hypothetical protein
VEEVISFISQVGFLIVVTLYLLYRIESKLDAVVQSIQELPSLILFGSPKELYRGTMLRNKIIRGCTGIITH